MEGAAGAAEAEGAGKRSGGLKVKLVLTRGELEWLLLQLKEKREKKLEDVLGEIGRRREARRKGRSDAWRPSLESITEISEPRCL
ncbi:unnamed protein product [Spirodela intermedia]|uniref:Uncharacterized protein n=1 Tax=Spirodela intermedia TaxID=51605 RepID=A0A7I8J755_SPIIN|nr:unnamed protein product [Spirodela intermedia]CAA6665860.1 unnamed protein product [Spirodela intermedia]